MKRNFRRNNRGQFAIIAALLVAVILISTLITTYSSVRSQRSGDQPQVLSTVDETNLALKQLLGFTVGYYGSILRVTGNTTYAQDLASTYLNSGLENIADARPELGLSFKMSYVDLHVKWFVTSSYSYGQFNVTYDITSLGVYGLPYFLQSRLEMQVLPAISGEPVRVYLTQDASEPLNTLTKENFKLYRYLTNETTWDLIPILGDPQVFSNGTYLINIPPGYGVDSTTCILHVTDSRGIIVIGSAFNGYSAKFSWSSPFSSETTFVNQLSNLDGSVDKGSHGSFDNQKAKDNNNDTLTEQNTGSNTEQYVVQLSNLDNSTDMGFHSNFTKQNLKDNSFDTLTEQDVGNYELDLEEQFTGVDYSQSNEWLCVYAGNLGAESLKVDVYSGGSWVTVVPVLQANQWNNVSVSSYLTSSMFTFRFKGASDVGDLVQDTWQIDAVLLHTWSINCELDLEEQFTGVDYSQSNEWLCVYAGNLGAESLKVDVYSGGSWVTVVPVLQANQWNNVSVSSYLTSSMFTFRFKGASDVGDLVQDTWQIDSVLLSLSSTIDPSSIQDSTIVVEWLQNGTLRMLGQGLQSTTQANPIPPIPVKGIHLNQTFINGTNREVAFQIENWVSSYIVPLGLTNNATVFSNIQMIVFLLTIDVSKVTIWWNGDDTAVQTPYAYLPGAFNDNPVVGGTLNNSRITLKFPSSGFNVQTTTVGGVQSTANFMRINNEVSNYGAGYAFVVHHGVVRDIVQQEPEWNNGAGTANDCPNLYSSIVITLPARASYFTYQLKLTFINSASKTRTISDLSPIQLSTSLGSVQTQTENGTSAVNPIVSTVTGTFVNYGGNASSHHWSQFTNPSNAGTGILFADNANQNLYFFDLKGTNPAITGALNVSTTAIELAPVTSLRTVLNYNTPAGEEVIWNGAIATFDTNMTPVYKFESNSATGLWILVEYSPIIAVTPII